MVGVGGWCAPKARARKDGLPKEMACSGDWCVPKARDAPATKKSSSMGTKFLLQEKSSSMGVSAPKGSRGRSESPLVASAEANPLLSEKSRYGRQDQQFGRAHLARHSTGGEKAAWGRICGCAKLLAGTLRCLRLGWRLPLERSPAKELGRCPKPHKGAPPLDPARGIPP